jgi:hypothetical protein
MAAVRRFPWNMLCGAAGAASAIVSVHLKNNDPRAGVCMRLIMTAALGMPLFFSLRMLRERSAALRRWPIELLGVPLLAAWFVTLPARPFDGPSINMTRWLLLLAAFHFFAAISAYTRSPDTLGFWQFNRRLFLRFALATLYTGVLTVGLELALLSADKLFELKLDNAYVDLWFLMTGFFHPAFFLAGVPCDFASLADDEDYPRGLKAFTQFALAPLVAVYTAILYAYALKIIFTRTWPHGWVALPVLLLSGIGILAALLLYPLRNRADEKWAAWFTRTFPRALVPLSVLLLLSLQVRIGEYGVTEERYIGAVLGTWILVWALVFVVTRDAGIRWMPTSLAIICFLAAYGPWSAGAISKTSQLRRLTRILQAHGLWKDGHAAQANTTADLSSKDETNLETTINYLVRTHGGASIRKMFEPVVTAPDWSDLNAWHVAREIVDSLKSKNHVGPPHALSKKSFVSTEVKFELTDVRRKLSTPVSVSGFREAWRSNVYAGGSIRCGDVTIAIEEGAMVFSTAQEQKRQNIDLEKMVSQSPAGQHEELPNETLTVDLVHGDRNFRVILDRITFRRDAGRIRITGAEFYLLEK